MILMLIVLVMTVRVIMNIVFCMIIKIMWIKMVMSVIFIFIRIVICTQRQARTLKSPNRIIARWVVLPVMMMRRALTIVMIMTNVLSIKTLERMVIMAVIM